MSTLGFEVHVDKENATPAMVFNNKKSVNSIKGLGTKKSSGKLTQPTPRKALFDVNHGPQLLTKNHSLKDNASSRNITESLFNPIKPSLKIAPGSKDQYVGLSLKRAPIVFKNEVGTNIIVRPPKHKKGVRTVLPPEPALQDTEDGYNSDSIFPHSERQSSYINKLLAWRPPCLFGSIPDSESEHSDPEDWLGDAILLEDEPVCLTEVPDILDADVSSLLVELPPMKSTTESDQLCASLNLSNKVSEMEMSLTLTPDTSLCFGSLKVLPHTPDISDIGQ